MDLEFTCEGKADCTAKVTITMKKSRTLQGAGRPVLCPDCFGVYGCSTSKTIDQIDPRPKTMPPREVV